jgi:hypothetical protein
MTKFAQPEENNNDKDVCHSFHTEVAIPNTSPVRISGTRRFKFVSISTNRGVWFYLAAIFNLCAHEKRNRWISRQGVRTF